MDKDYFTKEIFDKSPIGTLFYDKEGNLVQNNPAALDIIGINSFDLFSKINLFDNHFFTLKKEELFEEGLIKFQTHFSWENTSFDEINEFSGSYIDWIVFVIDSGFLVQIQDITDLKTAEKSLKENEEKYRRWFDDDLTGDFIALPEGKIIECNPSFVDIYGFNNYKKAVGSNISEFNTADWEDMIAQLKNDHKILDFQSWQRRPDGKEIHVVANMVGIFDDAGNLVQVKGYVFDDTERKIAEEALIESEEKYHLLFDEDLTGDFIATPDGKILECNPAFADIYGFFDVEMALQWNISQSNPFDWPYIVTRLKTDRKLQGFQSWQRRSDGMKIHVVANVVGIFDDAGNLVQVKGYVFDDTERKNAEEELARSKRQITEILDSIQDCFVAVDHSWNFIYVNRFAADFFGMDVDDIIGRNIWELFPDLRDTIYEISFRQAMDRNEIQHFEAPGLHSDHCYDFSIYPSVDGLSAYWRDISDRE